MTDNDSGIGRENRNAVEEEIAVTSTEWSVIIGTLWLQVMAS